MWLSLQEKCWYLIIWQLLVCVEVGYWEDRGGELLEWVRMLIYGIPAPENDMDPIQTNHTTAKRSLKNYNSNVACQHKRKCREEVPRERPQRESVRVRRQRTCPTIIIYWSFGRLTPDHLVGSGAASFFRPLPGESADFAVLLTWANTSIELTFRNKREKLPWWHDHVWLPCIPCGWKAIVLFLWKKKKPFQQCSHLALKCRTSPSRKQQPLTCHLVPSRQCSSAAMEKLLSCASRFGIALMLLAVAAGGKYFLLWTAARIRMGCMEFSGLFAQVVDFRDFGITRPLQALQFRTHIVQQGRTEIRELILGPDFCPV